MITVKEAKQLISKHTVPLSAVRVPLSRAYGHLLASEVYAHYDIPSFRQSSMDGYAIRFADHQQVLSLAGEMAAGTSKPLTIQPGEACRIFTGAPLPDGADTVVMQEKVAVNEGYITVQDPALHLGANVRAQGAEIENGALAMTAGSYLSPAAVGFLAGIGTPEVGVFDRGTAWLDTGTFASLMQAGQFVQVIEERQGLKIGAIEEVAFRMKYINKEQLTKIANPLIKSGYGEYLMKVCK